MQSWRRSVARTRISGSCSSRPARRPWRWCPPTGRGSEAGSLPRSSREETPPAIRCDDGWLRDLRPSEGHAGGPIRPRAPDRGIRARPLPDRLHGGAGGGGSRLRVRRRHRADPRRDVLRRRGGQRHRRVRRLEPAGYSLRKRRAAGPPIGAAGSGARFRANPGVLRPSRLGAPRDRPGNPREMRVGGEGARLPFGRASGDAAGRAVLPCARILGLRASRAPFARRRADRVRADEEGSRVKCGVAAVSVGALLLAAACNHSGAFGHFVGTVKTEWIEPNRRMRLLDDFAYVDAKGVEWKAPKGSVVDGASIPQVLWSVVGSPYTGEYRNASVVHDVACEKRDKPWQDVHRMFYEACLAGGVAEQKAKLMYAAVYHFVPKCAPGGASSGRKPRSRPRRSWSTAGST